MECLVEQTILTITNCTQNINKKQTAAIWKFTCARVDSHITRPETRAVTCLRRTYSHMDVLSSGIVPPKLFSLGSLDIVNDADDATHAREWTKVASRKKKESFLTALPAQCD